MKTGFVPPVIGVPFKYHWYDGPETFVCAVKIIFEFAQLEKANFAPSKIVDVGTGFTVTIFAVLAELVQPKLFATLTV